MSGTPHFPKIPQKLPFLEAVCWQITDAYRLAPEEMLHRYERGWHYRGVLEELSPDEAKFIQELSDCYGSWIGMDFKLDHHQKVLKVLSQLNSTFLEHCSAYFGGGTYLALKYHEYRVSKDIDFLCSSSQGYRLLRQEIFNQGYSAIFANQDGIKLPREIQANQYGVRFPVVVDNISIKFEVVMEGRIDLGEPDHPPGLPVACLNLIDCFAEKLLANADRWIDSSVQSRDLIDLAVLRLDSYIPEESITKAENAYPVVNPLKRAIANFQEKPDYRHTCYQSLMIQFPKRIIEGIDLLAADFGLSETQQLSIEDLEDNS